MFQCIYTEKCLPHGTILQFRFGQDTFCKVLRLNEKGGRCAPPFPKMPTFRFTDADLCLQRCASSFLKMRIFGGERYASSGMKMRIFETGQGLNFVAGTNSARLRLSLNEGEKRQLAFTSFTRLAFTSSGLSTPWLDTLAENEAQSPSFTE